jgi:hypothetical protein
MEATIQWIFILSPASGTHLERCHGRGRAVVGDISDDREAGAAVGAVDERIAVAAVLRIEQLRQAVAADAYIG